MGPGQIIDIHVAGNQFTNVNRPLTIGNTFMASIGTNNTFSKSDKSSVGILIVNSSVSISDGNTIDGFAIGLVDMNLTTNPYFLNISGVSFTNNTQCVEGEFFDQQTSDGVSLFVENCSFDNNNHGIISKIQNGGTGRFLGNHFMHHGGSLVIHSAIELNGDFPKDVLISGNQITSPNDCAAFRINMPLWDAGNNMIIDNNPDLQVTVPDWAIWISLKSGGLIHDNVITTTRSTGIYVFNTEEMTVSNNLITGATGSAVFDGSIFLHNSPRSNVFCNTTSGTGGGIVTTENCDESTISKNIMNNHDRGLNVFSFYGDAIIGGQTYRQNLWNGGSTAEASLVSLYSTIDPFYFQMSQFKVEETTSNLWPNPIDPSQSPSGSQDEWFWEVPKPVVLKACPGESSMPTDIKLTPFEKALINGGRR